VKNINVGVLHSQMQLADLRNLCELMHKLRHN